MAIDSGRICRTSGRVIAAIVTVVTIAACATSPAATPAGGTTGTAPGRRNAADTTAGAGGQSTAMERGVGQTVPGDPSAGRAADSTATAAVAGGASVTSDFTNAGTQLAATATSDAQIVGLLHQSNLSEIAAGQLAQQRAQDASVKSFAQQMVTEHTALDSRGSALASQAGITPTLPDSTLPKGEAQSMATLQGSAAGSAFDRAYIAQQVGAHQRTLALVEASIGKAQNGALKSMLQDEVRPKVAAHLQQAQSLQRTVGTAP